MRIDELDDAVLAHVGGPLVGRRVDVGEVTLDTHLDGPDGAPVLLLVSGLGAQRITWPPELIAGVHAAGRRTLTVDNRDVGRSTVLAGDVADLPRGDDGHPLAPYGLADLASDLVGVLDAFDLPEVDVLGMSMGGMVAQHLAVSHAPRVRTLTSLMSTTGATGVGAPHHRVSWVLRSATPTRFADYLAHADDVARAVGSPGHHDPVRVRARATAVFARGIHPQGTARQLTAIRRDGDRTGRLAAVRAPTLVLHGSVDPLIDVSGGVATAEAVDGARLCIIEGMGHDLPVGFVDTVLTEVLGHLATHG